MEYTLIEAIYHRCVVYGLATGKTPSNKEAWIKDLITNNDPDTVARRRIIELMYNQTIKCVTVGWNDVSTIGQIAFRLGEWEVEFSPSISSASHEPVFNELLQMIDPWLKPGAMEQLRIIAASTVNPCIHIAKKSPRVSMSCVYKGIPITGFTIESIWEQFGLRTMLGRKDDSSKSIPNDAPSKSIPNDTPNESIPKGTETSFGPRGTPGSNHTNVFLLNSSKIGIYKITNFNPKVHYIRDRWMYNSAELKAEKIFTASPSDVKAWMTFLFKLHAHHPEEHYLFVVNTLEGESNPLEDLYHAYVDSFL